MKQIGTILLLVALAFPALAASGAPTGWTGAGSRPQDYDFGTDVRDGVAGKQAAYIKARDGATPTGFGSLNQCILADKYVGQRLRLSARLQSVDAARVQLWMRADGADNKILAFYNMVDRPLTGTTGWQQEQVVLDVPQGGRILCYGFFLAGGGAKPGPMT